MRISSALLPLLATAQACLAFTVPASQTSPSPSFARRQQLATHPSKQLVSRPSSTSLSVSTASEVGAPGTAELPWSELGFEFRPTKSHLRMVYRNGEWSESELVEVRALQFHRFLWGENYTVQPEMLG